MAVLKKIVVQDFRNIVLQELEFSPNINCISGDNGTGKTNLLDAVWYLSMTKSSRGGSDRFSFRHGTGGFALAGTYALSDGSSTRVSIRAGGSEPSSKQVRRDDKIVGRLSDHIGEIPVVMVSPADGALVSESAEERRRFANSVLSQMDRSYLFDVQKYNKLLSQRNAVLKDAVCPSSQMLDVLEEMMGECATRIWEARRSFAARLEPQVEMFYHSISSGQERVGIEYRSDLDKGGLAAQLKESRNRDSALRYTLAGVQRDDFLFTLDGYPIRKCGSQGQQKSFLVALKFAQYELMKIDSGHAPILLLDDLFDKLDMTRVSNLLSMVASSDFGQIFITDSNKVRIRGIVDGITADRAYFEAAGGAFSKIDE